MTSSRLAKLPSWIKFIITGRPEVWSELKGLNPTCWRIVSRRHSADCEKERDENGARLDRDDGGLDKLLDHRLNRCDFLTARGKEHLKMELKKRSEVFNI